MQSGRKLHVNSEYTPTERRSSDRWKVCERCSCIFDVTKEHGNLLLCDPCYFKVVTERNEKKENKK